MELVQVATCTGPKFVHVATCTSQHVQVATCTSCLYKLQFAQAVCTSCNLYRFLARVACCTKSQLVHNMYINIDNFFSKSSLAVFFSMLPKESHCHSMSQIMNRSHRATWNAPCSIILSSTAIKSMDI